MVDFPYSFNGNASDEFIAFVVNTYRFAIKHAGDVAIEISTPYHSHNPNFADGFTLSHRNGVWRAEVYEDFVTMVLRWVPPVMPDGDLRINLDIGGVGSIDPDRVLVRFWHD